jgi:hypothetical protein
MGIVAAAFCDFLGVTYPRDEYHTAREAVLASLPGSAYQESEGRIVLADPGAKGLLAMGIKYGVGVITASGGFLQSLRHTQVYSPSQPGQVRECYPEFLAALSVAPHRVTKLHATMDLVLDGREVVPALYERAKVGGVTLTRKAVPPSQVSMVRRPALYGPGDTGTAYIGKRTRDVWVKVYDKRNELLDRREVLEASPTLEGFYDPGPLTRYELALGRHVGCTLRDAADPTAVFWHHMGDLLPVPQGVASWAPMAEGYSMPPPHAREPIEQLRLLLDSSPDVARAVVLADKLGPHGRTFLGSMLAKLVVPAPPLKPSPAVGA